jgi:hypothetical protein
MRMFVRRRVAAARVLGTVCVGAAALVVVIGFAVAASAQGTNSTAPSTTFPQVAPVVPPPTVATDSGLSNPTVRPMIAALLGVAALLGGLTWWFVRATRPFPDALDGLAGLAGLRQRRRHRRRAT